MKYTLISIRAGLLIWTAIMGRGIYLGGGVKE